MALTVATNTGALMAQAAASSVNKEMEISMERLASGKRINGASDDAAGVAIASRLTSEIKGTNQAIRNAMDGQALIDTAEGAHQEIENILQRMRELSVQSRNDTNGSADRANIQLEIDQLTTEIDRIANSTSWAGQKLLTGNGGNSSNGTFTFQVGSRTNAEDTITSTISAMTAAGLGVGAGNASVGANGATASLVGANVIQVSGNPAVDDVYSFTLNGESISIKLENDASAAANFDYKVSIDGAAYGSTVNTATVADGKTAAGVADIIAEVINARASSNGQSGITATAAADASVTILRDGNYAGADLDTEGDGTIDTLASVANDRSYAEIALGTVDYSTAGSETDITFAYGGDEVTIQADDADSYADSAAGLVAKMQAAIDASSDFKGLTITVSATDGAGGAGTTHMKFAVAQTSGVDLLSSVAATAGNTTSAVDVTTTNGADAAIVAIDSAILTLNSQRASLGSISNRLDSTVSNLTNISSNLQAGRGRIEDADFAAETTTLAKSQILQQASTAMLAQANASKQNVLSLLQG